MNGSNEPHPVAAATGEIPDVLFRHILENLRDGVLVLDRQERLIYANAPAMRLLGIPEGATAGWQYEQEGWQVLSPTGQPLTQQTSPITRILQHGESLTDLELALERRDGARYLLRASAQPLRDATGDITGLVAVLTDVTSCKGVEEERSRAHAELELERARLQALLDATADAVLLTDPAGTILHANETLARRWNCRVADIQGRSAFDAAVPDVGERRRSFAIGVIQTGRPAHFEDEHLGMRLENTINPILDAQGMLSGLAIYSRDITGRHNAMQRLNSFARQQAAIAELGQQALFGADIPALMREALGTVAHVLGVEYSAIVELPVDAGAPRVSAVLGWDEAAVGQTLPNDMPAGEDLAAQVCDALPVCLGAPSLGCGAAVIIQGKARPFGVLAAHAATPHTCGEGDITFLRSVANILGAALEQKRYEEELRYLGSHDALTGLYNRGYFEAELARLQQGRRFPVSVFVIDVDGLKTANDSLGHAAGDELIRRVGAVLHASFRKEDLIARIGGDEFAIILPQTDARAAARAFERLRQHEAADNRDHTLQLQLSIGVATADIQDDFTHVVRMADERMYLDKYKRRQTTANTPTQ